LPKTRDFRRALRQALSALVCPGRRTLSRIIWTNGGHDRSQAAEYCLYSRSEWQPQELFAPILKRALFTERKLLRLAPIAYEASADSSLWPEFLKGYTKAIKANAVSLQIYDFRRRLAGERIRARQPVIRCCLSLGERMGLTSQSRCRENLETGGWASLAV